MAGWLPDWLAYCLVGWLTDKALNYRRLIVSVFCHSEVACIPGSKVFLHIREKLVCEGRNDWMWPLNSELRWTRRMPRYLLEYWALPWPRTYDQMIWTMASISFPNIMNWTYKKSNTAPPQIDKPRRTTQKNYADHVERKLALRWSLSWASALGGLLKEGGYHSL